MESYKSIIKSTSIIAFVQIIKIFFVFLQNKILAIVVGTAGYGIFSLYYTFSSLVSSFSTFGIDQSGVRQVARNSEKQSLGKTLWTIRVLLFSFSFLSFFIILIFSKYISHSLFGNYNYRIGVIIIGAAIFFNGLSQGYLSILNGLRRLKWLAYSQIFGIVSSASCALLLIFFYGVDGIPFFILIGALVLFLFSFFYTYQLKLTYERPDKVFFRTESRTLLSLGAGLAYSAVIVALSTYLTQVFIRKSFGLEWVGMYNASNIISNVYLGMLIAPMGVDLMPRLAKVIDNDFEVSNLINYQLEFTLLLSTIGVVAVIVFAPQLLMIIYSSKFIPATSIMKWHVLGASLSLLSYPLGYILIVKKQTLKYVIVQTVLWAGSYILLIVLSHFFGVQALGLNVFMAFIFYVFLMYVFNKKTLIISSLCKKIFLISWFFILSALLVNIVFNIPFYLKNTLNIFILSLTVFWTYTFLKRHLKVDIFALIKNKIRPNH